MLAALEANQLVEHQAAVAATVETDRQYLASPQRLERQPVALERPILQACHRNRFEQNQAPDQLALAERRFDRIDLPTCQQYSFLADLPEFLQRLVVDLNQPTADQDRFQRQIFAEPRQSLHYQAVAVRLIVVAPVGPFERLDPAEPLTGSGRFVELSFRNLDQPPVSDQPPVEPAQRLAVLRHNAVERPDLICLPSLLTRQVRSLLFAALNRPSFEQRPFFAETLARHDQSNRALQQALVLPKMLNRTMLFFEPDADAHLR